ncbi:uncharacterized protein HMPREF1541_03471 [Cyphellophora europaea CBS 101466]|uniref:Glycoside hydrolase family 35 protein n=1 Tax=Cyphellophora europaea (strain CBS 101466) TaxID=1220924 RepID=W2RYX6_CYPE1|nr:uncharacterized protein HMPREF1541_03471 [Cyphellophora europaea CBS 101466]ETN41535.1 hypothetical protein HMPREF1541_03471 [Cyphellophora europaea CBS 101466]
MTVRNMNIPHLRDVHGSKQLIVDGHPFLLLGAELQNSSLTSADYMQSVWPKLAAANINTVLGCVTWEQIEAEEGKFNFEELDRVIADARLHKLKLVLLWFGSFKNGLSTYTPSWVKLDTKRFPRAQLRKAGGRLETADVLSIFGTEAQKADTKAFRGLMNHLQQVDEKYSTVIMVQVENEIGLLGDSRDGGALAEKAFSEPVPDALIKQLHDSWDVLHPDLKANLAHFHSVKSTSGKSWIEIFGTSAHTDELFMAYHYTLYVEQVASAGQEAYRLPLYTNVWQNYMGDDSENPFPAIVGGGGAPGDYPSGGAVTNVIDIWQEFAPSLDFISPDVYLNNYSKSCAHYRHRNNPLFIPEQRRDEHGARRIWAAYGTYGALGCSPFGIDTLNLEGNPFRRHYGLLKTVSQHVLAAQTRPGSSYGFYFDEQPRDPLRRDPTPPHNIVLGNFELEIKRSFVFGHPAPGFGMVIHLSDAAENRSRYLLIGFGFQVTFKSTSSKATFSGILSFEEKEPMNVDGKQVLKTARMLNGDETRSGKFVIMPSDDPDYGDFPICVTIPGRTGVAECEAYAILGGN